MKTLIGMFNNTTEGFSIAQKSVVALILATIVTGAVTVLVGAIVEGAPNLPLG